MTCSSNVTAFVEPSENELVANAETYKPEELDTYYDAAVAPILSNEFWRACSPHQACCAAAAAQNQLDSEIQFLKSIRNGMNPKMRMRNVYARSQEAYIEELRNRVEFATAATVANSQSVDPVTRYTTGLLQWPLGPNMTTGMSCLAIAFGIIAIAVTRV